MKLITSFAPAVAGANCSWITFKIVPSKGVAATLPWFTTVAEQYLEPEAVAGPHSTFSTCRSACAHGGGAGLGVTGGEC